MENSQNNDDFMEDDEFILRINLGTQETRVYRGSQLADRVINEEVEPVELTIKL